MYIDHKNLTCKNFSTIVFFTNQVLQGRPAYPDFNKLFDIHTDYSNFHLGSVISQGGKLIAFRGHGITVMQTPYIVTEDKFLSTVRILNEFCMFLLGSQLKCT